MRSFESCSCGDPDCRDSLIKINEEVAKGIDQSWVQSWGLGEWREHEDGKLLLKWLREQPPAVREVIRKFPPNCLVRASGVQEMHVPHADTVGVVKGYMSSGDAVGIAVKQTPSSKAGAVTDQRWLEVVGYWRGLTPDEVGKVLADA